MPTYHAHAHSLPTEILDTVEGFEAYEVPHQTAVSRASMDLYYHIFTDVA